MKYFKKHWWEIIFVSALMTGFFFGISGFMEADATKYQWGNSFYETFRLFEREYHSDDIPANLMAAQWILLFAFLWLSLKIIITIIAPHFLSDIRIRLFFRKHIVICGLNEMTWNLVRKYNDEKIIVLAEERNQYAEAFEQKGIKMFFCGDIFDKIFLQKAQIPTASRLYIVTGNDKNNVEITQSAFSLLKKKNRKEALKCYTLINDRELKLLLEESALFKYRTPFFDSLLFNMNEMGIQYDLSMNIDKILPQTIDLTPEILIVGLTEKAETVILSLVHCLTMNRVPFRWMIVEKDKETIRSFQKKYAYLPDFAEIEYTDNLDTVCSNKRFTSIFVCPDNQIEAMKTALFIRYRRTDNLPNIFIFSEESENWTDVFNTDGHKILTLKNRNIFLLNTFEATVHYVMTLNSEIEILAETAHNHWRKKDAQGHYMEADEYHTLSGHLKQTNRNQIIDTYLHIFIATGKKLDITGSYSPVVFSEKDRETLAMMEHRRWMIEKYSNGWRYGDHRNDDFKIHNCLKVWEKLPESEKRKDYTAIELIINRFNEGLIT
ncbi:MAG: NAD-binding protein [Dysgonamonadaceae bacterium]|jgi:hypothetical protein|nr:NAD-binding protein [Dysgonamonadaceae bacterium]